MADDHCLYEDRWGELTEYHRHNAEKLDKILEQAFLTNGRIRKLETFRLVVTIGFIVFVFTTTFMLIAHEHGWIQALMEYGTPRK
jgi:hypothetical protein